MRIYTSALLAFLPFAVFCQKLELTKLGLEMNIVSEVKDRSAQELFELSREWVAFTFMNQKEATQSEVYGKMIRLYANSPNSVRVGPLNYDLEYIIQIDIKDNKIRFRASQLRYYSSPLTKIDLENALYKTNGKPKTGNLANSLRQSTSNELKRIHQSLIDRLSDTNEEDDW